MYMLLYVVVFKTFVSCHAVAKREETEYYN